MKIKEFIFLSFFTSLVWAETPIITVCFTPGEDCTQEIVETINSATEEVYVQAYSFTSRPIENALLEAKEKGVQVEVILDKSILSSPNNAADFFVDHHIPVWIDERAGIAHNKVMIIDGDRVITGSFNFTRAAQARNAENLLIIHDMTIAEKYLENWHRREKISRVYHSSGQRKMSVPDMPQKLTFKEWMQQFINLLLGCV